MWHLLLFTWFMFDENVSLSPQGITFEEFRSFFQFLNNLEDFAIAMQMYNFAHRSIGQGEELPQVIDRLHSTVFVLVVLASGET